MEQLPSYGRCQSMSYASAKAIWRDYSGGIVLLTDLYARQRQQGHATALMEQVVTKAQQEDKTLFLAVGIFGPRWLKHPNTAELYAWYQRLGFVEVAKGFGPKRLDLMAHGGTVGPEVIDSLIAQMV